MGVYKAGRVGHLQRETVSAGADGPLRTEAVDPRVAPCQMKTGKGVPDGL